MKEQIINLTTLFIVNCLLAIGNCRAQNIGINTTGSAPASTNMLEVLTPATMTSAGSTGLYVGNPAAVAGAGNYGYAFQAIKTGAGLNNIAAYLSATGGTNNYGLIVADGLVGIGATIPQYKLHVYSTNPALLITSYTQFIPVLTADQNANLHGAWNTILPGSSFNINADVYGAVNRIESSSSQTGTISGAYGSTNDVYNSGTGTVTGAFGSANYVRNISTGTITNAYGLQANVTNAGTGTITNGYGILISSVEATNKWSLFSSDPTAPSYFAGNVGIGTSVPNARLDVKGSGSTNATYGFGVRNSSDVYSLVVADNGYVGIGTIPSFAAPQMPLHLHSSVNNFHAIRLTAENTTTYWDIIKRGNTYAQPNNFVIAFDDGLGWQEHFQITPGGNFGMGVNNPTNKLEVAGNIWATGDIYLGASGQWLSAVVACTGCSDLRYKKDVTPFGNSLADVLKLQGVKYNWRQDEFPAMHFNDRRQIGFIAQEMEKVFPEIINTNKEGYKSIDYAKLTPVLVEAIKEQQKIIEQQQSSINSLQSSIKKMNVLIDTQKADIGNLQTEISEIKNVLGVTGKK